MDVESLRRGLLGWYGEHQRTLPWRPAAGFADPYAVFVSEVMLQQTRVETVMRHFQAWMERFPDWQSLADAEPESVMAQWAGLGYYRRARNLHAAAKHVAAHGLPDDLQALPGVGPYMAGAVASIALGQPVPAVDGNVVRVLARLAHITDPVDRRQGRRQVEALAAQLVDPQRPGDWNQALMDLGSTICTPRSPRCTSCPVARSCKTRSTGTFDVPVTAPRRRPREEDQHFAMIQKDGRVLVVARPPGLLAGTWMLPGGPVERPLCDLVREQAGVDVELEPAGTARHVFTHRVWNMQVHVGRVVDGAARGKWVDPASPEVALSTAACKAVAAGTAGAAPA